MKNTPFKRILVALDLSTMDKILVNYSFWFAKSINAEKVYFIYCAKELREVDKHNTPDGKEMPRDETIHNQISSVVKNEKLAAEITHDIIVDQAMPLEGLLYWKDVKKIDLLMVGKKKSSSGSGVISKQFVRQSDCPVLFIPEEAKKKMDRIIVPIDFSENSRIALKQSIGLQSLLGNPEIICLNVFSAAPGEYGMHEVGLYSRIREKAAVDKYLQFISPLPKDNLNIKPVFIPDNNFKIIENILAAAKGKEAGLIIIGAVGHSKVKLLTVGSTAEKMMLADFDIPLMVIKK